MRPCALVPVKWRLPECMRTTLPLAVILKRLAAPRWVLSFIFGFVEFLGIGILVLILQLAQPVRSGAAQLQIVDAYAKLCAVPSFATPPAAYAACAACS